MNEIVGEIQNGSDRLKTLNSLSFRIKNFESTADVLNVIFKLYT